LHFSQGDGEISFCGAIEIAGRITVKFDIVKNGMMTLGMKSPVFIPGPVEPNFGPGRMLTFEGFSVDSEGKQHYLDVNVAYKQTCLRVIEYLKRFGYSGGTLPLFFFLLLLLLLLLFLSLPPPDGWTASDRVRCEEQIYLLLSCAPVQGHIGGIVDIPNACTTMGVPMDIFDFDISPAAAAKNGGVAKMDLGSCAYTSDRK